MTSAFEIILGVSTIVITLLLFLNVAVTANNAMKENYAAQEECRLMHGYSSEVYAQKFLFGTWECYEKSCVPGRFQNGKYIPEECKSVKIGEIK